MGEITLSPTTALCRFCLLLCGFLLRRNRNFGLIVFVILGVTEFDVIDIAKVEDILDAVALGQQHQRKHGLPEVARSGVVLATHELLEHHHLHDARRALAAEHALAEERDEFAEEVRLTHEDMPFGNDLLDGAVVVVDRGNDCRVFTDLHDSLGLPIVEDNIPHADLGRRDDEHEVLPDFEAERGDIGQTTGLGIPGTIPVADFDGQIAVVRHAAAVRRDSPEGVSEEFFEHCLFSFLVFGLFGIT